MELLPLRGHDPPADPWERGRGRGRGRPPPAFIGPRAFDLGRYYTELLSIYDLASETVVWDHCLSDEEDEDEDDYSDEGDGGDAPPAR